MDRGIIIVNTGDGKGKSTAAFGTVFRAIGQGLEVAIIQFIKGDWKTGEMKVFEAFDNITHIIAGEGFTWLSKDREKDIKAALKGWDYAKNIITGNGNISYDLLVLDELNVAIDLGFIDLDEVVKVLKVKDKQLNIIITGRSADSRLIEIADTVTEMVPVKHAFDKGINAIKGIEF